MKRLSASLRVLLFGVVLWLHAALPALSAAQVQSSPLDGADGRILGYEENSVVLDDSSTALTYFILIGLTVVAIGLMFKSSRRTHLD
jgi:hypothetical protein